MSWRDHFTTEKITRLFREYARKGMSQAQMAKAVGHGMTKAMAAGICRRARPRIVPAWSKPAPESSCVPAVVTRPRFAIVEEVEPGSIHLMDDRLRQNVITQCRAPLWPDRIGTRIKVKAEEAHFCGRKTVAGSSYCAGHHSDFWVKPEKKPSSANADRAKAGHKMRRLEREAAGE